MFLTALRRRKQLYQTNERIIQTYRKNMNKTNLTNAALIERSAVQAKLTIK